MCPKHGSNLWTGTGSHDAPIASMARRADPGRGRRRRGRRRVATAMTITQGREYLERMVDGMRCLHCNKPPAVAWLQGAWALRCGCYPEEPKLFDQPDGLGERWGKMVNKNLPADRKSVV